MKRIALSITFALFLFLTPITAQASTHHTYTSHTHRITSHHTGYTHHTSTHTSHTVYKRSTSHYHTKYAPWPYPAVIPLPSYNVGEFVHDSDHLGQLYAVMDLSIAVNSGIVSYQYQLATFGTADPIGWTDATQLTPVTDGELMQYMATLAETN
jgi:hypothetical protein